MSSEKQRRSGRSVRNVLVPEHDSRKDVETWKDVPGPFIATAMTESTSDPLAGVCTPVTSLEASDAIHDPSLTQIAASVVPTKYHSSFKDRSQDTLSLPERVIFISTAIAFIFVCPPLFIFLPLFSSSPI